MKTGMGWAWCSRASLAVVLCTLIFASGTPAHAAPPASPLAWGYNGFGQLGNGSKTENPVPVPTAVDTSGALQGRTITALATGGDHSLALDSTGLVYAWGRNDYGQLGNGSTTQDPVLVPGQATTSGYLAGKTIIAIAAGQFHSLALDNTGVVYGWGINDSGEIGNDSVPLSNVPVPVFADGVLAGKTITAIAAGRLHSLALDSAGKVYAWGYNNLGQLGNASTTSGGQPVAVDTSGVLNGKTVVAIAAGNYHSLALDSNGQVYVWGDNEHGELGNGSTDSNSVVPVVVDTSGVLAGKTITAIAGGGSHNLALDSAGVVYAWGNNANEQLGDSNEDVSRVPLAVNTSGVLANKTIIAISGGLIHSLALNSDGSVYAWGSNNAGQLGNANAPNISPPVMVSLPAQAGVTALAVGCVGLHSLVLAGKAGPTLDVDIALTEVATPAGSTVIAEGRLYTLPDPKNPTNSIGTFADNLAGGKTYPAAYDDAAQQLTLNTIYGRFVLKRTPDVRFSAVSYPTRFGTGQGFVIQALRPHKVLRASYYNFSAYPIAGVGSLITGQLTLTEDMQLYLVPDSPKTQITSRLVGTIGGKPFVAPIISMGFFQTNPQTGYPQALVFSLKIAGQVYRFQGNIRGETRVGGIAYADGATKYGVVYTWTAGQ